MMGRTIEIVQRLIFVPFDQLHFEFGALKNADPARDLIVLVESERKTKVEKAQAQRTYFYVSAARHFAEELRHMGFEVVYKKASSISGGLREVMQLHPQAQLVAVQPSTFAQTQVLTRLGAELVENDFFLTPRPIFLEWAKKQKSFVMENFYRQQRIRLGLLVEGDKPTGGQWNFDKENRLPPPKNYDWPPYLEHEVDEVDRAVGHEVGHEPNAIWATTRAGARAQLAYFVTHHLPHFGPYEDAMTTDNWALHHSLLSPYMNVGLLHPQEVVDAAVQAFESGTVPIACIEGFVRQIIGWREYVNGMYWFLGADYKQSNHLNAQRALPPLFNAPELTKMKCVGSVVQDLHKRAWVHHIPRLMVLSNIALLSDTNPQSFLDWMQQTFIDATEWVMVPNVIGMGLHADGGLMMTKPYVSGGAYISRMSNYCSGCPYDPKLRSGENACPFTTLYWDFLDRHTEDFAKNHRMSQQYAGLKRLADRDALHSRAKQVLKLLDSGEL